MQDTIDSKTGEVLTTKVTGFYYGEPEDRYNELYNGKPTCKYDFSPIRYNELYNGKPTCKYDFSPITKKSIFKRVADWFVLLLTGKGPITNEAVDNDIVDYSGQGRDKYGH
jgi:hypothetical protein